MSYPPYPSGPFAGQFVVGGGFGGSPFQTCQWVTYQSGLVVKQLDSHDSIVFAPGEKVTSLTLWGDGDGTCTSHIHITTSAGQTFDCGKDISGQTAYDASIGSGIFVCLDGRSGADVDTPGAFFLNGSVTSISISNLVYNPPLTGTSAGISQIILDEVVYSNPSSATQDVAWNFSDSVTLTTSTSFTQSSSTTYGVSVTVDVTAELFEIGASVGGGYTWETTGTQETNSSTSTEETFTWGLSGELSPGESLTATSFCQQGTGEANCTSTVKLALTDGMISSYSENGVFNNVVYTSAQVSITPSVD
ncbi:hypothetical protein OBBRIDRAFT_838593 [Obba rivulosa]|uniref:Uncharacterized protein n=1 Tax=Obba rivulosa TaxID=1052685 RepID=A0A8E2AV34_9APHY|nr:hypothetical protein OBBRIDRAFT_838593 [Obba rivulosa]